MRRACCARFADAYPDRPASPRVLAAATSTSDAKPAVYVSPAMRARGATGGTSSISLAYDPNDRFGKISSGGPSTYGGVPGRLCPGGRSAMDLWLESAPRCGSSCFFGGWIHHKTRLCAEFVGSLRSGRASRLLPDVDKRSLQSLQALPSPARRLRRTPSAGQRRRRRGKPRAAAPARRKRDLSEMGATRRPQVGPWISVCEWVQSLHLLLVSTEGLVCCVGGVVLDH
jgi:hypothetical protein